MQIVKSIFLEIENISFILNHLDKITEKEINNTYAKGTIDIDVAYKDIYDQECFKSLPFDFSIELEGMIIKDISLEKVNLYIVDRKGINIEYSLMVESDESKEIEIIDISEPEELTIENKKIPKEKEDVNKIKEDISKEYEEKLHDELSERNDKSIIKTKSKTNARDFLDFFDRGYSSYFKIKTLECDNMEELNTISKEYGIPYQELLYGYDKENGRVIFKLKE